METGVFTRVPPGCRVVSCNQGGFSVHACPPGSPLCAAWVPHLSREHVSCLNFLCCSRLSRPSTPDWKKRSDAVVGVALVHFVPCVVKGPALTLTRRPPPPSHPLAAEFCFGSVSHVNVLLRLVRSFSSGSF